MTSPFTDEELARLSKNPQHDISDLARRLLEAGPDAKRYRWLRTHWVSFYKPIDYEPPVYPTWYKYGALDAAIDAALAEGK